MVLGGLAALAARALEQLVAELVAAAVAAAIAAWRRRRGASPQSQPSPTIEQTFEPSDRGG